MPQISANSIQFLIAPEFASYWGQTQVSRFIRDDRLILKVRAEDYTEVSEGKGVKIKRGYLQSYGDKEYKRIGFRIRVRSQLEDLYLALRELAELTAGDTCKLNPIKVHDYCHFHDREDRDRGYRIRTGVFEGQFSQVQGTGTQGYYSCNGDHVITGSRYGSGFSFKFMELDHKYFF